MAKNFQLSLEKTWAEVKRLHAEGETYAALVSLGEIACVLRDHPRDFSMEHWRARVAEIQIEGGMYFQAVASAKKQLARLEQILNVGTTFIYEEWMLMLTIRVELEMFLTLLEERRIEIDFDTSVVDREFIEMARLPQNRTAYHSAQAACRRNWLAEIPIRSEWLKEIKSM